MPCVVPNVALEELKAKSLLKYSAAQSFNMNASNEQCKVTMYEYASHQCNCLFSYAFLQTSFHVFMYIVSWLFNSPNTIQNEINTFSRVQTLVSFECECFSSSNSVLYISHVVLCQKNSSCLHVFHRSCFHFCGNDMNVVIFYVLLFRFSQSSQMVQQ